MSIAPNYPLRRAVYASLVGATIALCTGLMTATLAGNGLDLWDLVIVACFLLTLPWAAVGFWNAVIGLILLRTPALRQRALAALPPRDSGAIASRTALLSCIRNEDTATVARNLEQMLADLAIRGEIGHFDLWILSDSSWGECIAAEEEAARELAERWRGRIPVQYRRRPDNPGYKAGNIRDFMIRHGDAYDFALVLDADSVMSAQAILKLVRTMQDTPTLGILQTLVVGLPSASAFARPFQFGMRLGMRSYTLGSAWWQGDCGPYWGHNALLRVAPFRDHCELPRLPGRPPLGGWVLSHDQVEAVLMRRAGFEVRVLPVEDGSFEENPPTLLEFIRRDLRWCQGNLQYLRLLGMPGLRPVSRVQLLLAILMFLGSAGWVLLTTLGIVRAGIADDPGALLDPRYGGILFLLIMTMVLAPKLASLADALLSTPGRRSFGGGLRLVLGSTTELVFSTLMSPIMAIAHTVFMAGLPFGKALVWEPQRRGGHRVGVGQALQRLWPQSLIGLVSLIWMAATLGSLAAWLSPFFLGAMLAVPIAVLSASPWLGALLARIGLWRIPEEIDPPPIVRALDLPAVAAARPAPAPLPSQLPSGVGAPATETLE